MNKELTNKLFKQFELKVNQPKNNENIEFWYARDLQELLNYKKWDNFQKVILKAKKSCENSKIEISDHFANIKKMVALGSGAKREIQDIKLTRYACYLIAQNGDSNKEEIAFAQTYFAIQTRKQEIIEKQLKDLKRIEAREKLSDTEKSLASIVFQKGVDSKGFAIIKSQGDKVLFGGNKTSQMKEKLKVPKSRPLADFLPQITITAKTLANEITEHNIEEKDLSETNSIKSEHKKSNKAIRDALIKRNIIPEKLPPAEDIKKVERLLKSQENKLINNKTKISNGETNDK